MTKTLTQVHAEYEAQFPGFIARTQVAEATRRAQLQGVPFTLYNAQAGL
jgi:hypothetical protein